MRLLARAGQGADPNRAVQLARRWFEAPTPVAWPQRRALAEALAAAGRFEEAASELWRTLDEAPADKKAELRAALQALEQGQLPPRSTP